MNIPMVDLKSQYLKIKNEIDEKILNVINKTEFINGTDVKEFSIELSEYLGVRHVIPCGNGTDALQIAMMALGLQPGDEVISSDFTFIATVETIALLKLKPVMLDVDPDTYLLNIDLIEKAITPRTKAIIPVHLFGQCIDMEKIMEIANKYNLYVIEDTAQAIGSDCFFKDGAVRKAGTIGHIGCTSFFPSKNLGCFGDGGAIFTNDEALAAKISSIVNHGMKVRYHHDRIGVNSRLDTIQAAVLRVKLPYLDRYNEARRRVADYYDQAFANCEQIITPKRNDNSTHTFHQYVLVLQDVDREALIFHLKEKGISSAIYYPIPLHNQKAFSEFSYDPAAFPVSDKLCESVLALPVNTELDEATLKYIVDNVKEFLKSE